MSVFQNQSRANPHRSDYVWQYEYYDDEEPVSFEGLRAHRYSIVIGFWVGLAVFVFFMFFVLTLLTKTGPTPHQETTEPGSEKRRRPEDPRDPRDPRDPERAVSRPLLGEPRSFFHFYISEEEQRPRGQAEPGGRPRMGVRGGGHRGATERTGGGEDHSDVAGVRPVGGAGQRGSGSEDVLMSHFDIPNFVNSESPSCSLGDDGDLLICETARPQPPHGSAA